eukprot:11189614-Lingulodinium_polyedra.AAC.1
MITRVWTRCRRGHQRRWTREQAGFWDAAVQGSSALRALLWRKLADEMALAFGAEAMTLLTDLTKFYDMLSPNKMLREMWGR